MTEITAIEPGRRKGRFNVYVDGSFAVALGERVLSDLRLKVGQTFDADRLKEVAEAEEAHKALESALRLLELRARSSKEIEQRLREKGYEAEVILAAIAKLTGLGLIDDADFARQWVESRSRARPKGARLLRSELAQKGVAKNEIEEAVSKVTPGDEAEMARRALAPKVGRRALPAGKLERRAEYQRLAAFLQRRGFGWDSIKVALGEAFQEQGQSGEDGEELMDERLGAGDDEHEPRLGALDGDGGGDGDEDKGHTAPATSRRFGGLRSVGGSAEDEPYERRLGAMDGDASVPSRWPRRKPARTDQSADED